MTPLRPSVTRHQPDSTLPLINIVLLLVLAFMIAGTVAAPLPEGFDPLHSVTGAPETHSDTGISITMTDTGGILLDNIPASGMQVHDALGQLGKTGGSLSLKADSRAPASGVMKLLADAEDAGIRNAVVVTIAADQ